MINFLNTAAQIAAAKSTISPDQKDLGAGTVASVVITGIVVVFIGLVLLILLVSIYGKIFDVINNRAARKAEEAKKAAEAEKAAAKPEPVKVAAPVVEDGIEETLTYCDFPSEHWTRIRTNNVIERLNREIRRRTRVVGTFPDGNSALMLVCARLRHVAGTQWGNKKYMNMKHLEAALDDASIAG